MAKVKESKITFEEIVNEIKAKKYRPVYFFFGEESFFIDQLMTLLENSVLNETEKAFNYSVLYGKDVEQSARIVESAKRFPMMAPYQLILVREAQGIKDWEALESYFKKPTPTTILAFAYKNGKPDGRKTIFRDLAKQHLYFESTSLYESQLEPFVKKIVGDAGFKINDDALRLFVETTGNDISRIYNEISKIIIDKPKGSAITIQEIETFVGAIREFTAFELCNALGSKDFTKSFKIANYFKVNQKNAPLPLLMGSLYFYFVKLLQLSYYKTANDFELAGLLGVSPYAVKDYKAASRYYPKTAVVKVFDVLSEYDARGKGLNNHNTESGELIRELVIKILSIRG